jgi:probable F420-dependent oxidoreductase
MGQERNLDAAVDQPSAGAGSLRRSDRGMTFGVMAPHFGAHANPTRVLSAARLIEQLGFDAVWCRDHLLWHPHGHEVSTDVTFLEPLTTLSAMGALTQRIFVGTSVLIPVRSPLRLAQELATMAHLTGGRVIAGLGAGHETAELVASGVDPARRRQTVIESIEIVRRVWHEDHVTHHGEIFDVEDITIQPKPPADIPILFGGPSNHAVRLAGEHCDGWIAGIIPLDTLDVRLRLLHETAARSGREMLLSAVPRMRIATDRATARADIRPDRMFHEFLRNWEPRPNGTYETLEDFRGAFWAGEPGDILEAIGEYAERGFDHFVFDLRDQFDRFEESLELVGERVLPEARRATAA